MSSRLRWSWGIVAFAAAVLLSGGAAARADKLLRWKFTPGQTLAYAMDQEVSQNMKMGATPVTMTATTHLSLSAKIDAVDGQGVASVTQTIDRFQSKMSSPQGILLDYDSASEKPLEGMARLVAPLFEALVKKPITMKIDPRGLVSDVKLPPGLMEAVDKMGGGAMQNVFSEDGMKEMMGLGTVVLAEKPVSRGDTWFQDATVDMPMFGTMKTKTSFRYEGTEKREGKELDRIAGTMQMDAAPQKDRSHPSRMKITDQKTEGTIYFDSEAGQLVEYKTTTKMKTTAEVSGQQFEQDWVISQTFRQAPPEKTP